MVKAGILFLIMGVTSLLPTSMGSGELSQEWRPGQSLAEIDFDVSKPT